MHDCRKCVHKPVCRALTQGLVEYKDYCNEYVESDNALYFTECKESLPTTNTTCLVKVCRRVKYYTRDYSSERITGTKTCVLVEFTTAKYVANQKMWKLGEEYINAMITLDDVELDCKCITAWNNKSIVINEGENDTD